MMRFIDFKKPGSPNVLFINERSITCPLSKSAEAHKLMEASQHCEKIVLFTAGEE